MPGVSRYSVDRLPSILNQVKKYRIPMVALFPYTPEIKKDQLGSEALNENNLICKSIRLIKKNGAQVKTILTENAKKFVTPLSVVSLSQEKVYTQLFDHENEAEMDHISLSRWADLILIAPATANTISKLSYVLADDLATTVTLA